MITTREHVQEVFDSVIATSPDFSPENGEKDCKKFLQKIMYGLRRHAGSAGGAERSLHLLREVLQRGDIEEFEQTLLLHASKPSLPIEMSDRSYGALEAMKVVFNGSPKEGDIFRRGTLPDDWTLESTDSDVYFRLVDGEGRPRAWIYYDAETRAASLKMQPWFTFSSTHDIHHGEGRVTVTVMSGGGRMTYQGEARYQGKPYGEDCTKKTKGLHKAAKRRLDRNYSGWRDPAYGWEPNW